MFATNLHFVNGPRLGVLVAALAVLSCRPIEDSAQKPAEKPPPAPPSAPSRPKFGDYVYVDELPEAITKVAPVYPDEAGGIQGVVLVQALVLEDGTVGEVRVVDGVPVLMDAAVACVRQWRFKPARADGKPVAVWVAVPVQFPPQ